MTREQITNNELGALIHHALVSDSEQVVPPGLTERVIQKLVRRNILRELIFELLLKGILVLVSLAVLTGVLVWIKGSNILAFLYTYFINNWQPIISILILALITILIDQIGLRFYSAFKKGARLKV